MLPVYWHGLVLWVTRDQYDSIQTVESLPEATDEQIAQQDAWYEQAQQEMREEAERWGPFLKRFAERLSPD